MVLLIKALKNDLFSKSCRYSLVCKLCGFFPGKTGILLRDYFVSRHISSCGRGVVFWGEVQIYHPERLTIGDKVMFGPGITIQASGNVTIGDGTIFGPSVKVWSANHLFDDIEQWIPDQGYDYKAVHIGKNCWIGANVFIIPGAEIGDGCIVSAGAVVGAKKYPPYSIVAGNPARKVGSRIPPNKDKKG